MRNLLFDGLLAKPDPGHLFAVLKDGRSLSYQDVREQSAQFANALRTRGVEPGDRVAVQVSKSIEALILYLGTIRAGAVFLPLNTAYTIRELAYFLADATPRIFVCDLDKATAYKALANSCGVLLENLGGPESTDENCQTLTDLALASSRVFNNSHRGADDLAAILYTSGTTGRSKGAMLTHDNLLSNAEALVEAWEFTANDVLLHALPIFHTHGLFVATNVTLMTGGTLLFLPAFNVDDVLDSLPQATSMMGVPTFYMRLLDDCRFNRERVAHIRLFISGSAPLLAETHVAFETRTGHRILERYGMTETSMNTSNPYAGERRAGSVGLPLPGTEIRITNPESGDRIARGEIGVIEVRGRNVFKGYWQMPGKTREEVREDGFFITGDLGRFDEAGYLQIVGRAKDLIISGGFNIYPKEIELLLDQQTGVRESAVIGVPHPDFGEGVVGILVPDGSEKLIEAKILSAISGQIARFKQPKRIFLLAALPRNSMGKVQKNTLREQFQDTFKQ